MNSELQASNLFHYFTTSQIDSLEKRVLLTYDFEQTIQWFGFDSF